MESEKSQAARIRAKLTLAYLVDLLASADDFERLLDGYLETRRVLTYAFKDMAQEHVEDSPASLEAANRQIQGRMLEMFHGKVPDEYLVPRGFSSLHCRLLNYLQRHQGSQVPAERIRVLSGEQVHTERRIRELREFGFDVESSLVSGEQSYALRRGTPKIDKAAYDQARRNIMGDRSLGATARELLIAELDESLEG